MTIATAGKCVVSVIALLASFSSSAACAPPNPERYDFRGEAIRFQVSWTDADAIVLRGADRASFEVMDYPATSGSYCSPPPSAYGRDKARVYFRGEPIGDADPATWTFIDREYARDKTRIYFRGKLVAGADPATWKVISAEYAQDKYGYYALGRRVQGSGFVMLDHNYAKTDKEVFMSGIPLKVTDAPTFQAWRPSVGITRDKAHVYFRGVAIPGADVATFEQVDRYLFKDRRAVYLEGRELEELDPVKLRVSKYGTYALDERVVFSGHKRVPRDASTFEELQPPWSKDKDGVYHWDRLVKDADIESFIAKSVRSAYDKNYRYDGEVAYCKINSQAPTELKLCPN
ncbi:DKNYY domain-containing protein [Variovorax jilinensis]|uniref:DKNYY domain-containing protein n=1 Tax=Variovorax jilinensis TaxID=3053513 RepID=UPI002574D8F6|nr:DKNYY domain-containing protein [Variovorax sp. J22P168]